MAAQSDEYVCCDDDGNEDPKAWEGRTPEGFGMGIDGALPPPIVIKESTDPVTVVVGLPLSEAPTLQSMPGMVVGLPPGAQNRFTPPEVE
jgi:hypothetical protein